MQQVQQLNAYCLRRVARWRRDTQDGQRCFVVRRFIYRREIDSSRARLQSLFDVCGACLLRADILCDANAFDWTFFYFYFAMNTNFFHRID